MNQPGINLYKQQLGYTSFTSGVIQLVASWEIHGNPRTQQRSKYRSQGKSELAMEKSHLSMENSIASHIIYGLRRVILTQSSNSMDASMEFSASDYPQIYTFQRPSDKSRFISSLTRFMVDISIMIYPSLGFSIFPSPTTIENQPPVRIGGS